MQLSVNPLLSRFSVWKLLFSIPDAFSFATWQLCFEREFEMSYDIVIRSALSLCLLTFLVGEASAEPKRLAKCDPSECGLNASRLAAIDEVVAEGLRYERMPGCVVLVGYRGRIAWLKSYGSRQVKPDVVPMTTDTVFDLASLTKPIATATSIMLLIEDGLLELDAPATKYIPEFGVNGKEVITIRQLLTHQSGLLPDNSIKDYENGRADVFRRIHELDLRAEPGTRFMYSDVGFIVLGEIVERVSGKSLDVFAKERIFTPLRMSETGFNPHADLKQRSAPTQERNGEWMRGEVHDPRAFRMDGVAGHAGLFSTAKDLARYAQMLINNGTLGKTKILKPETCMLMQSSQEVSSGIRTLGWDRRTGYSSNRGDLFSPSAFGHGGFTGTALWIDTEQEMFVIFLSNRVHPDGKGSVNSLAGRIGTIAAAAIND
ncbi:MAG: CubicO group peptidase (beta-lactamase class C family) [Planctomycetaceae bacterium]|jgi:CubicO group peptidase (beta-lactamase class C family)